MKIEIKDLEIKSIWDVQQAIHLLRMNGLSGNMLSSEQYGKLERYCTRFIWECIKVQAPGIEKLCTGSTGGFNSIDFRNYETPIICIHGHFYMQFIKKSTRNEWSWESIELNDVYRFNFNHEGYFMSLVKDAYRSNEYDGYTAFTRHYENLMTELKPHSHKQPKFKDIDYMIQMKDKAGFIPVEQMTFA